MIGRRNMNLFTFIQQIKKTFKCESGFTLIEVMTATLISSLILVMSYTAYNTILKTIINISGYAEFYEDINLTLMRIDRDISNMYYKTDNSNTVAVAEEEKGNVRFDFLTAEAKEFNIIGDPTLANPQSDIIKVGYFLEKDDNIPDLYKLMRRHDIHYDDKPLEGGTESVVLYNVTNLIFEFKVGNDWEKKWDSRDTKKFPTAIKTTLKVKDYNGNEETFMLISSINING